MGNAAALGFFLCSKCGLPFTAKSLGAHAPSCNGNRPSRPLEPITSSSREIGDEDSQVGGEREGPSVAGPPNITQLVYGGSRAGDPDMENSSPGLFAPLIAAGRSNSMMSPTMIPVSSTPGGAAARALHALMLDSPFGEEKWL